MENCCRKKNLRVTRFPPTRVRSITGGAGPLTLKTGDGYAASGNLFPLPLTSWPSCSQLRGSGGLIVPHFPCLHRIELIRYDAHRLNDSNEGDVENEFQIRLWVVGNNGIFLPRPTTHNLQPTSRLFGTSIFLSHESLYRSMRADNTTSHDGRYRA